jgi:hypothetical protein
MTWQLHLDHRPCVDVLDVCDLSQQTLRPIISHLREVEHNMGLIQRDHETVVAREQAQQQQVEFLQNQIQALRSAFTTLSEVIVSEMGAPRIVMIRDGGDVAQ